MLQRQGLRIDGDLGDASERPDDLTSNTGSSLLLFLVSQSGG